MAQGVYLVMSGSGEIYKTTKSCRQLINQLGGREIFG
jgi:hypothetical protein